MTIHTVVSVHCDCCPRRYTASSHTCYAAHGDYFDDAIVAARRARWHVDARTILCPACWEHAIEQEEE